MIGSFFEKSWPLFLFFFIVFLVLSLFTTFFDIVKKRNRKISSRIREAVVCGAVFLLTIWSYLLVKYLIVANGSFTNSIVRLEKPLFDLLKNVPVPKKFLSVIYGNLWENLNLIPPLLIAFQVKNRKRFFFAFSFMYVGAALLHLFFPTRSPVFCYKGFSGFPESINEFQRVTGIDTAALFKSKTVSKFPMFADLAFPSLHVGYAFLLFLISREKLRFITFPIYVLILAGSVFLGFHYVSDGIFGTVLAYTGWRLSEVFFKSDLEKEI